MELDDSEFTSAEFGIFDSIPDLSTYKSYTERYFTKRYITNVNGIKNNDIMIMFHSNRIALLCLAPSHFFFNNKEEYTINFNIGKIDRRNNSVKGKGKKGGQLLMPNSIVCKVEYKDGTSFDVPCCMKGKLIEVNEELVKNPELLKEMPDADGFIAVMLSTIEKSDSTKNEMLTPEDYLKSLNDDGLKSSNDDGLKSSNDDGLNSSNDNGLKSSNDDGLKSSNDYLKSSNDDLKSSKDDELESSNDDDLKSSNDDDMKSSNDDGTKCLNDDSEVNK